MRLTFSTKKHDYLQILYPLFLCIAEKSLQFQFLNDADMKRTTPCHYCLYCNNNRKSSTKSIDRCARAVRSLL